MSKFNFIPTFIKDLYEIENFCEKDERGFFNKIFEKDLFSENNIDFEVVENFYSYSKKGVLRGLHFQDVEPQAKLVGVVSGEIFDVAVDLRRDSATYLKWHGVILNNKNNKTVYIPRGFAHGFLVLSDEAMVIYQCDNKYYKEYDTGIIYDDADIDIKWPDLGMEFIISDRDKKLKKVKEIF